MDARARRREDGPDNSRGCPSTKTIKKVRGSKPSWLSLAVIEDVNQCSGKNLELLIQSTNKAPELSRFRGLLVWGLRGLNPGPNDYEAVSGFPFLCPVEPFSGLHSSICANALKIRQDMISVNLVRICLSGNSHFVESAVVHRDLAPKPCRLRGGSCL